ncbi:MAG: succinate dehydrogenase iron-sulfur subunit [Candidatus Promineifilaceae bacterium]|nr:succinate dehydrogenase iron-sulfur subunit [Candidatus Promineifilaceae bacterium]
MPTERATIRVQRYNPDLDAKPYQQEFTITPRRDTTILDALHMIKAEQDGSLTFRRSCRHAICGSCAMNVNGRNRLVCNTPLSDVVDGDGRVSIKPLPYLPIVKDLVVDRSAFWRQYLRVKPWLLPPDDVPEHEYRVSPEEVEALNSAETCIMCGACYSACQVVGMNKDYIGPHALLKAFLRVIDPRDTQPSERLADLKGYDGVYRCHTIFNCIDACPKGLDPTRAIESLRKMAQKRLDFEAQRSERQRHLHRAVPVHGGD